MGTLCPSTLVVLALCTVAHAAPPNFVLMMSDDTGWGDMGYNNGTADTPNLDLNLNLNSSNNSAGPGRR